MMVAIVKSLESDRRMNGAMKSYWQLEYWRALICCNTIFGRWLWWRWMVRWRSIDKLWYRRALSLMDRLQWICDIKESCKKIFPSDLVGVSLIPFLPYSRVVLVYLLHLVDASQPSSQRRTCHDFCLMPNLLIHSLSVIWRKWYLIDDTNCQEGNLDWLRELERKQNWEIWKLCCNPTALKIEIARGEDLMVWDDNNGNYK